MTNEAKTEEYLRKNKISNNENWEVGGKYCYTLCKQAYLDGLAEGKPKWHNLREDPDDLPKETGHYLTDDGECVYDNFHRKWRTIMCVTCYDLNWLDDGDVIAWTELPKFEEE
ncbi:MAG: hypothetical protein MJZ11_08200 [Lachnospiraceae bacterium]|nr:hypothetical protein [Lachnospiraceae bacterium]